MQFKSCDSENSIEQKCKKIQNKKCLEWALWLKIIVEHTKEKMCINLESWPENVIRFFKPTKRIKGNSSCIWISLVIHRNAIERWIDFCDFPLEALKLRHQRELFPSSIIFSQLNESNKKINFFLTFLFTKTW